MGVEAAARDGQLVAAGAHDGYTRLPGRPVHRRQWRLGPGGLQVRDEIAGSGEHRATGFLHVQPGIAVTRAGERAFDLDVPDAGRLRLTVEAPASRRARRRVRRPRVRQAGAATGRQVASRRPAAAGRRHHARARGLTPCTSCSSPTTSRRRPTPRPPAPTSTRSAGCGPGTR